MTKRHPDSARLIWVASFVSFADYGNAEKAKGMTRADPGTLRRNIIHLEAWLHRMLITNENPAALSFYAIEFLETAREVLRLSGRDGLDAEMSETRILPEGVVTVQGVAIKTAHALQIGKLLVDCRAYVDPNYKPHPRISGADIDMSWFDLDAPD